tara:strand:- start:159 stop:317 length:159 start_codon:yes stop_codon:yes gene_type:complete
MKKLLLVLLFVPLISFGQSAEDYFNRGVSKENLGDLNGACADWRKTVKFVQD